MVFDLALESAAFNCGVANRGIDDGDRVQCLHDFRAVLARERHVGHELARAFDALNGLALLVGDLGGVTADLQKRQDK